jgi:galactokinase
MAGKYDYVFSSLYGPGGDAARQRERYARAIGAFGESYGPGRRVSVYSVPGRVELCGNHTDHNNGIVMAAAVDLDIIAVASKSCRDEIRLRSKGFSGEHAVSLSTLQPRDSEAGSPSAIIRGVAQGFCAYGGRIGGFDAYVDSDVLKGSGLSSSAAFEVCVGTVLNEEFNGRRFDAVTLGIIGQFAENRYFGKPSGLMDQVTCASGGAISIDLKDPSAPVVEKVPLDLASYGMNLVVTDTKGDHSGLTDEYAAIRGEMESVARYFGKPCLREVPYDDFLGAVARVRDAAGDRATLRALHFFEECGRVREAIDALGRGDMRGFLSIIAESGNSSFEYNQNAYSARDSGHQGIPVALALSQVTLRERGAWRLQGGGFAGTIQAFVPDDLLDGYRALMRSVFGDDACHTLQVRASGGVKVC